MSGRRWVFLLMILGLAGIGVLLLGDSAPDDGQSGGGRRDDADSAAGPLAEAGEESGTPSLEGRSGSRGGATARADSPESTLEGRVVDMSTGKGVGWARVIAFTPRDGDLVRHAQTDHEGGFELEDLTPGLWWLIVWHPKYVSPGLDRMFGGETGMPAEAVRLRVPDRGGALAPCTLEIAPGRRIEGRVVDAEGQPVVGARILLQDGPWRRELEKALGISLLDYDRFLNFRSDKDGRFVVACLPAAMKGARLGARKPGLVSRWSDRIDLTSTAPEQNLVLQLLATSTVSGHVRRADGSPAHPTKVSLSAIGEDNAERVWALDDLEDAVAQPDGAYRLVGLPPAAVTLRAYWTDPYLGGATLVTQALRPGGETTGVDITIPDRCLLTGRLVGTSGRPLAGQILRVREVDTEEDSSFPESETLQTEDDGAFVLAFPVSGPFEVAHLLADGTRRVLVASRVLPAVDLELVSEDQPRTRVTLRVVGPDASPVRMFGSSIQTVASEDHEEDWLFTSRARGKDGAAVHHVAGSAPFRIHVSHAEDADGRPLGLGSVSLVVDVLPPGGEVLISLRHADEVCGRIVGPDGQAVPGVRATFQIRTWAEFAGSFATHHPLPLDAEGRFRHRIDEEVDDDFGIRILVEVPAGYVAVRPVSAQLGEEVPTITLTRGGSLGGLVVAPAPLPREIPIYAGPPYVRVHWEEAEDSPGGSIRVPLADDNTWRADNVPLDVDLTAELSRDHVMSAGYEPVEPQTGLRAGNLDVRFELTSGLSIVGKCVLDSGRAPETGEFILVARPEPSIGGASAMVGVSGGDGRFEANGLAVGFYELILAAKNGWIYAKRRVAAGTKDVVLRVPRLGSVTLAVSGETIQSTFYVAIWDAGTTTLRHAASVDGDPPLVIQGVPSDGPFDITVSDMDAVVGSIGGVRAGDSVTVSLVKSAVMAGVLRRADGSSAPFEGNLYALKSGACFRLLISETGDFWSDITEPLEPGRYELRYVDENETSTVVGRNIDTGREDLELVLP